MVFVTTVFEALSDDPPVFSLVLLFGIEKKNIVHLLIHLCTLYQNLCNLSGVFYQIFRSGGGQFLFTAVAV